MDKIDKIFALAFIITIIGFLCFLVCLLYDKTTENDYEVCIKDIAKDLCNERGMSFSRIWGGGFTENNFVCLDDEERVENEMLFTNEEINRCLG